MLLNNAAYYDSNYEIINWVPHVLYFIARLKRLKKKKEKEKKKNNKLLSLPCEILPEFFFFFVENLHFLGGGKSQ